MALKPSTLPIIALLDVLRTATTRLNSIHVWRPKLSKATWNKFAIVVQVQRAAIFVLLLVYSSHPQHCSLSRACGPTCDPQPRLLPLLPTPAAPMAGIKMNAGLCSLSSGCSAVTSKEACAQAVNALGFDKKVDSVHNTDDRPPGCFTYRNYKVEFNTRLTSKATKSDMKQVCDCSPGPEPPPPPHTHTFW